ncbi:hypothetical protein ACFLR4_04995 [Bacteroidota bacterium]
MRYYKLIFPLLLSCTLEISAQFDLAFSGYAFDLPIYSSSNEQIAQMFNMEKNQFVNLTRIRLRPTLYMWDGARINIEYEISSVYSASSGNIFFSATGINRRQLIDLTWTPVTGNNFTISHFIDRFYFRQGFEFGNIIIGRQRISWGTGRVWNPMDLFNPISPTTFYKLEKDGADAVAAKIYLGDFTDLNLVFNPQKKIKNSNYGFRFRTNFSEYDVSMMGGYFDSRYVVGLDFAGNLSEAGIRSEGIYSIDDINSENNFIKFILGIDYQFTPELYTLLEYHFNGEGYTDKLQYQFDRLIMGEILNLSKNYLATSAMYQLTPLINVTLSNNINLNDSSGFISIIGNYSITSDIFLNLGTQLFYGDEFTEYWYYPNSFYFQAEIYF